MNQQTHVYEKHPKLTANIVSRLTFTWLLKLFRKGTQRDLDIHDLYETQEHNKSQVLGDALEKNWENELHKVKTRSKYKASFFKALLKTFYKTLLVQFIFMLILECGTRILSPYLLGRLIFSFNHSETEELSDDVFYLAGFLMLSTTITAFLANHSQKSRQLLGMRVRVASCSLLYRKILKLRMSAFSKTSNGQIVNLLSNDVNRFDYVFVFFHYLFILPFQCTLITYLIWADVGISAFVGVAVLALQTIPVQGYIGKMAGGFRMRIAKLTDERVILMNEIISGIQVIKMYAWEIPFENFVSKARVSEVKVVLLSGYVRGFNLAAMIFTERTTLFLTIVSYALMGNTVTASIAFSMAQYFNVLQATMALYYPNAIITGAEALVCIKRLQEFLLLDEQESKSTFEGLQQMKQQKPNGPIGEVSMKCVSGSWIPSQQVLKQLTTTIKPGELCAIIGPVGSGKSSILNAILSELTIDSGTLQVNGTVSYASQEPWLFVGSVRSNILFGLPYDKQKYRKVVYACSLTTDFQQFPYGDQTILGDKGSSLSGGQKARINLARCLYRDADVYLLDDPLSAVDTHVGKHLFDECLEFYLRKKTRLLVTHQIQHLQHVNHIIVIQNGRIAAEGTFNELMASKLEFLKIMETNNASTEEPVVDLRRQLLLSRQSTVQSLSNVSDGRPSVVYNNIPSGEEEVEKGKLSNKLYLQYFRAGASCFKLLLLVFLLIVTQIVCVSNDFWVSFWTQTESERSKASMDIKFLNTTTGVEEESNYTSYQVDHNEGGDDDLLSTELIVQIYGCIIVGVILMTILRSLYFYSLCMRASINLHNTMFHTLLKAPMRFFDSNPIGRILNRFAKDVGAVDELVPKAMIDCIQVFFVMIGILVLISFVNPYMMVPTFILCVGFIKIRSIFLETAQDIKRLEGITRSPCFSHTSATVQGLATIRSAIGAQDALRLEFDQYQDLHTSAWYLSVVCGIALGFWTDLLCSAFFACIAFSFIYLRPVLHFTGSQVGLALSQGMILTGMVQYGIKQSVELVCQMTSVERMLQYTKIEKEGPFDTPPDQKLAKTWPQSGTVHFNKLSMRYTPTTPPVLKELDLDIEAGEKVGIVGRTGAGKSSLISSLFHLSILDGEIIIDGMNVKHIGLKDLRSRISIIPQQPVLFSASMRFNLDPFNLYEDVRLWEVLEEVELKDSVPSLDFLIQGGGSNFSIGQRQLICLARAILKRNKILVLDEATANVDPQTDALIQETIRDKFSECTVLTIAHRLNTIMDSDKVLVMDLGKKVEFDHPHLLLSKPDGIFTSLVQETGPSMAEHLAYVAKQDYYKKFPYLKPPEDDGLLTLNQSDSTYL